MVQTAGLDGYGRVYIVVNITVNSRTALDCTISVTALDCTISVTALDLLSL